MALCVLAESPFERRDYETSIKLAMEMEQADVLLIQNAVYALKAAPADYKELVDKAMAKGIKFYALEADLKARGITAPADVTVINYDGFVDLVVKNGKMF